MRHQPVCSIAHDLVNHFAAIIGYADLLLEKQSLSEEYEKYIKQIREIAQEAVKESKKHQGRVTLEAKREQKRQAGDSIRKIVDNSRNL
jgi:hypothetical protein